MRTLQFHTWGIRCKIIHLVDDNLVEENCTHISGNIFPPNLFVLFNLCHLQAFLTNPSNRIKKKSICTHVHDKEDMIIAHLEDKVCNDQNPLQFMSICRSKLHALPLITNIILLSLFPHLPGLPHLPERITLADTDTGCACVIIRKETFKTKLHYLYNVIY